MAENTKSAGMIDFSWIRDAFKGNDLPSAPRTDEDPPDIEGIASAFKKSGNSSEGGYSDDREPSDEELTGIAKAFKEKSSKEPSGPDFSGVRKSFNLEFPKFKETQYAGEKVVAAQSKYYKNDSTGGVITEATKGFTTVFADAGKGVDAPVEGEGESGFRRGSTYDIVSGVGHGVGEAVLNFFTGSGGTALKNAVVPVQRGLVRDNVSQKDRGF